MLSSVLCFSIQSNVQQNESFVKYLKYLRLAFVVPLHPSDEILKSSFHPIPIPNPRGNKVQNVIMNNGVTLIIYSPTLESCTGLHEYRNETVRSLFYSEIRQMKCLAPNSWIRPNTDSHTIIIDDEDIAISTGSLLLVNTPDSMEPLYQ